MSYATMLLTATCRSELAREKPPFNGFIQQARVIVSDLREPARSYRGGFA